MTTLTLSDYRKIFSPNIRAMLNWALLEDAGSTVSVQAIDSHKELASLFTVWHVNPDGRFANWNDADAAPLTVGESFGPKIDWDDTRLSKVSEFQFDFEASTEPANLLLPVYAAGERFILLDSTHRAVAVCSGGLPFTALLVVLNGPISEKVLPDLRWHEAQANV